MSYSLSKRLIVLAALGLSSLHADTMTEPPAHPDAEPFPWLTGPLLTPSASVVPLGHYNIEPYEYVGPTYGRYDSHWKSHSLEQRQFFAITSTIIQIGMPADLDFTFSPTWQWAHIGGASHWVIQDCPLGFQYQLLAGDRIHWWPSIRFSLQADLPLGKYQHLRAHEHGADMGGLGNWNPNAQLSLSYIAHISGPVFFVPRCAIQYYIPTPVHVRGLNSYGGGHGTAGTVYPGQHLQAYFGFEVSLPHHWGLAGDIEYDHFNKTRFKGHEGSTDGVPNSMGSPSSESLSFAPAIEYNWSPDYGVIAGAWFTATGRNAAQFAQAVIAINIYL